MQIPLSPLTSYEKSGELCFSFLICKMGVVVVVMAMVIVPIR